MFFRSASAAALAAVSLSTVLYSAPVRAQDSTWVGPEPVLLDTIVVTANRWEQAAWTVPNHTTVITSADLRRAGDLFLGDALRRVSGMAVARNGSFGGVTSLFLRGGESDHVQVLVDGVQVNEPGGGFDLSHLTVHNVERIEILRGPGSALFGSDAVSGVVHVITRRGAGPARYELDFGGGSFGSLRWQNRFSGSSEAVSYSLAVGGSRTDGILAYNNEHSQTTLSGSVRITPDPRTDASVSLRYHDHTFHFPTDGAGRLTDRNAFTFGDVLSLGLEATRRWTDSFSTQVLLGLNESDRGSDDAPDDDADTLGFYGYSSLDNTRRASADVRAVYRFAGVLAAGVEFERQSMRSFNESLSEFGSSGGGSSHRRDNRALYGQLSYPVSGFSLDAGVRREDNERFGSATSFRTGGVLRLTDTGTRFRISAATGIKEPTFYESYATGFVRGNPDLRPERSTSYEVGLEQEVSSRSGLAVTAFNQSYRDLVQYAGAAAPEEPNFHNVAEARSRGIELEGDFEIGSLSATLNYTWLDTEAVDTGFDEGPGAAFVEGEALLRRPRHHLALTAGLDLTSTFRVDAFLRRVGERRDLDFTGWPAESVTLPAYVVTDLAASFDVVAPKRGRPGFAVTVRAENLLDEVYEDVFGFVSPSRGIYLAGRLTAGG